MATVKKVKYHKLIIIGFLLLVVDQQIKKDLDLGPSPANHAKISLKILSLVVFIS